MLPAYKSSLVQWSYAFSSLHTVFYHLIHIFSLGNSHCSHIFSFSQQLTQLLSLLPQAALRLLAKVLSWTCLPVVRRPQLQLQISKTSNHSSIATPSNASPYQNVFPCFLQLLLLYPGQGRIRPTLFIATVIDLQLFHLNQLGTVIAQRSLLETTCHSQWRWPVR